MKIKMLTWTLAVTGAVFAGSALAQHDEHQHQPPAVKAEAAGACDHGAMMTKHQEVAALVDQLIASFGAVENEYEVEARMEKSLTHHNLLRELQAKLREDGQRMETMHSKMAEKHAK